MQISVQHDLKKLEKAIPRFFRQVIPKVTSQALSDTARQIAIVDERKRIAQDIDRPKRFTKQGLKYENSTRTKLWSVVYWEQTQWEYMRYSIHGGRRTAQSRPEEAAEPAIPISFTRGGGKRDRYGATTSKWISAQAQKPNTFWGEINGLYGLWQRPRKRSGRLVLLAVGAGSTDHTRIYPFGERITAQARDVFPMKFNRRANRAIAKSLH